MKKKWIIPAIIAAVLVVIVSLIAFFPAMLINGMAKEQVKRLDNSYINSNYQGWNEVTFFDEHHFLLPDTWHIESISDATYCIYGDDARVIAFVGELGKDAPYRDTDAFCASMFKSVEIVSRTELHVGEHFGNGCTGTESDGFRTYTGTSYVCIIMRRITYQSGICNSSCTSCTCTFN